MPFYAFRLDNIDVKYQRGKIPDQDVVTFNVFSNKIDRGYGAAVYNDLVSGANIPAAAVAPKTSANMTTQWIVSPMEIAPADVVTIVYSGTNVSDWQLGTAAEQRQDQIEIQLLDKVTVAVLNATGVGAVVSVLGGLITSALDPIGRLLGFQSQGPCNGLVFSDAVSFTGAEIAALRFGPPDSQQHLYNSWPDSLEASFTRSYTDEATHNTNICGHIAETDVTFSVLQVAAVSVKYYMSLFHRYQPLSNGLRQFATPPGAAFSLRRLMHLRV